MKVFGNLSDRQSFTRICGRRKFLWSCGVAFVAVSAIVSWSFVDASFPILRHIVLWHIGIGRKEVNPAIKAMYSSALEWRALGPRYYLLMSIMTVDALALGFGLFFCVRDTPKSAYAGRWIAWLGVLALHCFVCFNFKEIEWLGIQRRASVVLPTFKTAGEYLHTHWPTQKDVVPELGTVLLDPERPERLYALHPGYPFYETFGYNVRRRSDIGTIELSLAACPDCFIGYCPGNVKALAESMAVATKSGRRWAMLDDEWYLVCYEP